MNPREVTHYSEIRKKNSNQSTCPKFKMYKNYNKSSSKKKVNLVLW